MIYVDLPKFNSQHAWHLPESPEKTFEIDGMPMATSYNVPNAPGRNRLEVDYPFWWKLDTISKRGTSALAASDSADLTEEISQLNDAIAAAEPVYVVGLTQDRYFGRPELGRLGRIGMLRGFILNPGAVYEHRQVSQVLEGKKGSTGRRYDMGHVLFPLPVAEK
jgi:hypothetical protein